MATRPPIASRLAPSHRSVSARRSWAPRVGRSIRAEIRAIAVALSAIALPAQVAIASDGVLEINQACAATTGCFAGDAAGYPVTIDGSAGRSYRLSSDLVVPNENTDGISISAPNTSIDLNGFEIVRAGCVGATTDCRPTSGSGSGIEVTTIIAVRGVAVHDGTITGMGAAGLLLGPQAEVRNLRARWNRIDGISANTGSVVAFNSAYQNGHYGIEVGNGSTVSGNTAYQNGSIGIDGNFGSTLVNNSAYENDGDGIRAAAGCIVQSNTARSNAGFGLNLFESGYRENVVSANTLGTVSGGVNMGNNSCNGTTTCP